MNGELTVSAASKDTLPTVFGYIGIGLAFGIVGKAAGLSPLLVTLMSIITYAGSAQFVIVSMLVTHSPIFRLFFSILGEFANDFNEYNIGTVFQAGEYVEKCAGGKFTDG